MNPHSAMSCLFESYCVMRIREKNSKQLLARGSFKQLAKGKSGKKKGSKKGGYLVTSRGDSVRVRSVRGEIFEDQFGSG